MTEHMGGLFIHEFDMAEQNIYVCFADVSEIDMQSSKITELLSRERIRRIGSIKKELAKKLSAGAELMLVNAVRKKYPDIGIPVSYSVKEHGKPYFNDVENRYFSLSHSGSIAVCAVSDAPVGVDVQKERKTNLPLAERFFSRREFEAVKTGKTAEFNRIWTRKEAVAKADGRGIAIGLKELDVMEKTVKHSGRLYFTADIPVPWQGYYMAVGKQLSVFRE